MSAVAVTLSGDGTTHKHVNYESKHITIIKMNKDGESIPVTLFAGISSAENHTSETQFDGWVSMILDVFVTYKDSPMGKKAIATLLEFTAKIKGVNTDHAEDQKKLFRLIQEWKKICDRESRGEQVSEATAITDMMPILQAANEDKIMEDGGPTAWDTLSLEEQTKRNAESHRKVCILLGEGAFEQLSPAESRKSIFWCGRGAACTRK